MIAEVERYKELLGTHLEIDDMQAVEIVIAVAVSHKIPHSEMLWLRIIGASGSGKTEILRTLLSQEGYCTAVESITPGAIRRGYVAKKGTEVEKPLLERLRGSLVITKEFAVVLTKDRDTQKEIFGLLRGVHDGYLDADYGSEQGHLHQETHFDWILGTTYWVLRQQQLETLLGSRFVDLKWGKPIGEDNAVVKAVSNDGFLDEIRESLNKAMGSIILNTVALPKPQLDYLAPLANLAALLRTPIERDTRTNEIYDIPQVELGTRFGQAMSRIARGLIMIGVIPKDVKPYLQRLVMDCMSKKREALIKSWLKGITKQQDIATETRLSVAYVNRTTQDLHVLGWEDKYLALLK